MAQKGNYDANVVCLNCGTQGNMEIKKGTRVEDIKCANCGCYTLKSADELNLRGIQR